MKITDIEIHGKTWFDYNGGNTYHSARVYINDKFAFCVPFDYGYGDAYVDSSFKLLQEYSYIDKNMKYWEFMRNSEFNIKTHCNRDCKNKEVKEHGGKQYKEFSIGDEVIFKPYEVKCKCIVKGIIKEGDRVFYKLEGDAISKCTGQSIVESKYYNDAINEF